MDEFWKNVPLIITALSGAWLVVQQHRQGKVQSEVHMLVNSNFGAQLQMYSGLARRMAIMTNSPEDESVAATAEKLWKDHQTQQSKVNAGKV